MRFLDSDILWHLFWAVPLFLLIALWGAARNKIWLKRLFPGGYDRYCDLSRAKRAGRTVLLLAALILFGIAAARPAWGERILPDSIGGRDLVVVMDVSKSMLSDNVRPTRLDHAKQLIREVVSKNSGDRFGLVAFAGNAELICPLTADSGSFLSALDALSTASAKRGGTNLQTALETALLSLEGGAESRNRAVILISDGGELEGDMSKMFTSFEKEHIPVFAIGIGEPGTPSIIPVPGANGGKTLLKDRSGNTVSAPLEEKNLTAIAAKTGGIYIRSTTLDTGFSALQGRIRALTPDNGRTSTMTRAIERAAYPVTGALICLVIFFLTGETRRTASAVILASLLLLPVSGSAQEPAKPEPSAPPKQEQKEPEKAKTALEMYNDAVKLQADGKAEDAAKQYEKAVAYSQDQPEIRAKSYLNLGVLNHLAARGLSAASVNKLSAQQLDPAVQDIDKGLEQLKIAEENYRESLRADSEASDHGASLNQAILLRDRKQLEERKKQIEELKKQQQKAQQQAQKALQDQQQKQDEKKDQQKQEQDKQQQQNQNSTAQAKQEAEKLRDQADSMKQEQMKQAAQQAADKLDEAQKAQQKNDDKKAEEAIKEALRKLGADPDKKDQDKQKEEQKGEQKQPEKQDQKKQDRDQDKGKDRQAQQPQPVKPAPDKKPEDQARENRLEQMRRENRNFRDELKERRQGTPALAPVEKDW